MAETSTPGVEKHFEKAIPLHLEKAGHVIDAVMHPLGAPVLRVNIDGKDVLLPRQELRIVPAMKKIIGPNQEEIWEESPTKPGGSFLTLPFSRSWKESNTYPALAPHAKDEPGIIHGIFSLLHSWRQKLRDQHTVTLETGPSAYAYEKMDAQLALERSLAVSIKDTSPTVTITTGITNVGQELTHALSIAEHPYFVVDLTLACIQVSSGKMLPLHSLFRDGKLDFDFSPALLEYMPGTVRLFPHGESAEAVIIKTKTILKSTESEVSLQNYGYVLYSLEGSNSLCIESVFGRLENLQLQHGDSITQTLEISMAKNKQDLQ